MNNKHIWINAGIFDWEVYSSSSTVMSDVHSKRAYELWEHAKILLENDASDFAKADAITNLKRSLNHRWQLIEELYDIKKIAPGLLPAGNLERLEKFGLVRPYMLKQLLEVRNKIEHHDHKPPEINRCMELLDLTWYFLRSTDRLVICQMNDLFYYSGKEWDKPQYLLELEIDFLSNHKMTVRGWLPESFVSPNETAINRIKINLKEIRDRVAIPLPHDHTDKQHNDIYINGEVEGKPLNKLNIMKSYFMCNE